MQVTRVLGGVRYFESEILVLQILGWVPSFRGPVHIANNLDF
jgi:hypothetical protein